MATLVSAIETLARKRLVETTASFWTSAEIVEIIISGVKDLWRDIVDLKEEHFLTVDNTNVSLSASTSTLTGLPSDIHKVYLIEPRSVISTSSNSGLIFLPRDYNSEDCKMARTRDAITPSNDTLYYSITAAGGPVGAPVIYIAPQVTSQVLLSFSYIPTISSSLASGSTVPIPGDCDNALVAWTVAFARAKERQDRDPDPGWLAIYNTEKQHLLESLGVRQYQEPKVADALYEQYW